MLFHRILKIQLPDWDSGSNTIRNKPQGQETLTLQ